MTTPRPAKAALIWGGMVGLLSIFSCANQGAPPGGPLDRTGPQVVETFPDTFAVIMGFEGPVRIVFNERISERGVQGTLDGVVIISPSPVRSRFVIPDGLYGRPWQGGSDPTRFTA